MRKSERKRAAVATACSIYRCPAGFGVLAADDRGVVAHHLPFAVTSAREARELAAKLHPEACGENALTREGAGLLARYFAGERMRFELPLRLEFFTPFRQVVYRVVAAIPYGTTLSYARVAAACGSPGGARAIGGAMAANPLPILVPCHRVLGESGTMTGFTAPGGVDSKRRLLAMEGAVFTPRGALREVDRAGL